MLSAEQEQQAGPHHPAEPPRSPDWRGRRLHCLHPPHPVCGRAGPPALQPIRGDQGVAPSRQQVAQRSLPLLRGPCRSAAVIRYTHMHTHMHTHAVCGLELMVPKDLLHAIKRIGHHATVVLARNTPHRQPCIHTLTHSHRYTNSRTHTHTDTS